MYGGLVYSKVQSSTELWSFGQGGVVGHASKTLGGDSRQMHGELTAQLRQLQDTHVGDRLLKYPQTSH